jgi:hypothetical protein
MDMYRILQIMKEAETGDLPATIPGEDATDAVDTVTMDVPLMIRMLEYAREDAQDDMDLHDVANRMIEMSKQGTLTMGHYDDIVADTTADETVEGNDRKYEPCSACDGDGADADGNVCDVCLGTGDDEDRLTEIVGGRIESQFSIKTNKGEYKYSTELERDDDVQKIWHTLTKPDGEVVVIDFTPYDTMTKQDVINYIKLGMPGRTGRGTLDSEQLEKMAQQAGPERNDPSLKEDYGYTSMSAPTDTTSINFSQTKNVGDNNLTISASAKSMADLHDMLKMAGIDPEVGDKYMSAEPDPTPEPETDCGCGGGDAAPADYAYTTDKQTIIDRLRDTLKSRLSL